MFWAPIIAGATIGALTNKNPIKGALIGGSLGAAGGYALGGMGGATGAGTAGGGLLGGGSSGAVGSSLASGAVPTSAAQFEAAMGLPSSQLIGAGAPLASAMPTGAGMGLSPGIAGNMINKDYFAFSGTPFETYKGGQGLLSNATGNLLDTLPDYVTPKNVLGAANILSNIQQPQYQMPAAQGGGVRQGSTQGLNVNYGMAQPIKRRGYA